MIKAPSFIHNYKNDLSDFQEEGLVNLLNDLNKKGQEKSKPLIVKALNGVYSDFDCDDNDGNLSSLMQLAEDLKNYGFSKDLHNKVVNGTYDHDHIYKKGDTKESKNKELNKQINEILDKFDCKELHDMFKNKN
jgi:hypothetical protein